MSIYDTGRSEKNIVLCQLKPLGDHGFDQINGQGVSAGVKEVIGVFLRYTEGAYAVNYGNSSIGYLQIYQKC